MTNDVHASHRTRARVIVLGAGLAGLAAARDLVRADVDCLVLEARDRVGGRVEEVVFQDGRRAQLGGTVIGHSHHSYLELVDELGLRTEPGFQGLPGVMTWDLEESVVMGDQSAWLDDRDVQDVQRVDAELDELADALDPSDPLSHPRSAELDAMSVQQWLLRAGARPETRRLMELHANSTNQGATHRISLLAFLRHRAVLRDPFDLRVEGGSWQVPRRLAEEVGDRFRLSEPVLGITLNGSHDVTVATHGTSFAADAVICTIPARPLRRLALAGLSPARLASLRAQRHAMMAKYLVAYDRPFWEERGASGMAYSEGQFGTISPQPDAVLNLMITPEKLAHHLSAPPALYQKELQDTIERMWGDGARNALQHAQRDWGIESFTMGGVATYAPGDLTTLGRLHGTHEPPFFVAGSDHWYVGYMEGAVRTGREAARAVQDYLG